MESQEWSQTNEKQRAEQRRPPRSNDDNRTALVMLYFCFNLALTFYNKSLLNGFPFPYLMTSMHAASGMIGCWVLQALGMSFGETTSNVVNEQGTGSDGISQEKRTTTIVVVLYSTLYAANIAISNASLRLVSVPFHQIIRSTCPVFTLALGLALLSRKPHPMAVAALLPIVGGAIMSCVGELSFTSYGFLLTVLGTVLAAVKTVTTHLLQGGGAAKATDDSVPLTIRLVRRHIGTAFQYTPLELLQVMSPLACAQCLFFSFFSGELGEAARHFFDYDMLLQRRTTNYTLLLLLAGNGALAFALNILSFKTNRAAGPLTMTVVGNAKQVSTILLAIWFYNVNMGLVNVVGVFVALLGTAWYGFIELRRRSV